MKILFLIRDGFGVGGTIRTTFNLAGGLATRGHEVEVLSCLRRRDTPLLTLNPAVRLTALVENRPHHPDYDAADPLRGLPPEVYPAADYRSRDFDLMMERRAQRYLQHSDADVIIGTRSGLVAWVARLAPDRMLRIGQEHLTRRMNTKVLRAAMARHYPKLDAFVTVSQRDADDYRAHHTWPHTRLLAMPNGVPTPQIPPSTGDSKIVMSAGRLTQGKRFDVLIRAFAKVAANHPDWQLRIYGGGDKDAELRRLILELGLHNHVLMMGRFVPLEPEWAKAAIAASTSAREAFGMTLVEAMRYGVPVVSTNAPHGPGEIVHHGVDGLLTPVNDVDAFANALLELIRDPARRRAMAAASLAGSERFDQAVIAAQYEQLFAELAADRAARLAARRSTSQRWLGAIRRGLSGRLRNPRPKLEPITLPSASVEHPSATANARVTAGGAVELRLPTAVLGAAKTLVWRGTDPDQRGGIRINRPAGNVAEVTITIGDTHHVPAGEWALALVDPDGTERPLLPGWRDTRALLKPPVDPARGVRVQLPFRTRQDTLGLRVWDRRVHAEVGDVAVGDECILISGRLLGADVSPGDLVVEMQCRADAERIERFAARRDDTEFHVTVPVERLTAHRYGEQDIWDVSIRLNDDVEPVRMLRLLDDVHAKRTAFTFPEVAVPQTRHGPAVVRPYYTVANGLSVTVSDATP
jgi:glycosyltransferase involved in cell wall biosynthesis